jgi:HlyD family type I secretion membrane fusion protein
MNMSFKPPSVIVPPNNQPEEFDAQARVTRNARHALILLGGLLLLVGGGMALVPIQGAVVASGQVGAASRVKRIAHPIGGIVAQVLVHNGDHVVAGQTLVRLDSDVSSTANAMTNLSVDQLQAQRARLLAVQLGQSYITFPPELAQRKDPGALTAMDNERSQFIAQQSETEQQRAQLLARAAQYQEQISGYLSQIASLEREKALIQPERASVQELWSKGLVTIARLNQLERSTTELDGQIATTRSSVAAARAHITEIREQAVQLDATRRSQAGTQLAALNSSLNDQMARNASAADQFKRSVIAAPYDGYVNKLSITAIGDVIKPADPIMEIVPDKDPMIVEGMVQVQDIDQVRNGQPIRIRFTAFNSTTSPEINGTLIFVASEKTSNPDTKQSYYEVRASISEADLKRYPELALKSGMPAEMFIQTGYRSMFSYITKPLFDQIRRSFRDN